MRKLTLLLVVTAGVAAAQAVDVGLLTGGGGITASGPTLATRQIGVEACFFCEGRFSLFGEYSHWSTPSFAPRRNLSDQVRSADLAGGGLRVQWRSGSARRASIRPFLDFGVVGGRDTHFSGTRGGALGGGVLGGGVQVRFRQGWYVRPQVRAYGLSPHTLEGVDAHWAVSGLIGIGYSWR